MLGSTGDTNDSLGRANTRGEYATSRLAWLLVDRGDNATMGCRADIMGWQAVFPLVRLQGPAG